MLKILPDMLNIEYLRESLSILPEFADTDAQVLASDGYDGVLSILANIRGAGFPCVVLEDRSSGELGCRPGGIDSYSLVLWVMDAKARDEQENVIYARTFELMKRIVRLLVHDKDKHFPGLDVTSMPYNRRQGGTGCYGYEVVLTFFDNVDLSYE